MYSKTITTSFIAKKLKLAIMIFHYYYVRWGVHIKSLLYIYIYIYIYIKWLARIHVGSTGAFRATCATPLGVQNISSMHVIGSVLCPFSFEVVHVIGGNIVFCLRHCFVSFSFLSSSLETHASRAEFQRCSLIYRNFYFNLYFFDF